MTTYTSLPAFLTDIADAIRSKTGGSAPIAAGDMPAAISNLSGVNIGTATANRTSAATITFTGLDAEPKLFCVIPNGVNTSNWRDKKYIAAIVAYEDDIYALVATNGGSPNYYSYIRCYHNNSTANYTWTYSNGSLTVKRGGDSSYGIFYDLEWLLVYVY